MIDSHVQRQILAAILLNIADVWVDYKLYLKYNHTWGWFGSSGHYASVNVMTPGALHQMYLTSELEGMTHGQ